MITSSAVLTRWNAALGKQSGSDDTVEIPSDSRFPVNAELNQKIALWRGHPWELEIDAIVNEGDEDMSSRKSPALFAAAGAPLELETSSIGLCKTGETIVTNAYNLSAKKIIHTVGPKYNPKYQTAAENMLNSCYWGSLQRLVECGLHSIALCCIHTEEEKNYNTRDASHIAIRTVRRFLERYGSKIQLVVFCMPDEGSLNVYNTILPLYFPRSRSEELLAISELPKDTGNEKGETIREERKIRINAFPATSLSFSTGSSSGSSFNAGPTSYRAAAAAAAATTTTTTPTASTSTSSTSISAKSTVTVVPVVGAVEDEEEEGFMDMKPDIDEERRAVITTAKGGGGARKGEESTDSENEMQYGRYLKAALTTDLSDIEALSALYQCGTDLRGRPIFVFLPSNLHTTTDMNRVFLYLIKTMDRVVVSEYVIVYFHSDIGNKKPDTAWFKSVYTNLTRKYKKNLKALYIVHPTWLMKAILWFAKPFISEKFWSKVTYIDRVLDLYSFLNRDQITIPDAIFQYDSRLGGSSSAASANVVASSGISHQEKL